MVYQASDLFVHALLAASLTLSFTPLCALAQDQPASQQRSTDLVPTTAAVLPSLPICPALPSASDNDSNAQSSNESTPSSTQGSVPPSDKVAALPGTSPTVPSIIFIDNDDAKEAALVEQTRWEELPDEAGRTHISTGARFPVKIVSELSSKTAQVGDPVEGRTRVDVKIGGRLIAAKNTRVLGHVFNVMPARRMLIAEISPHRWWRANGEIGIQFDEMVTDKGEHIPLVATPAKQPRIVVNKYEGRVMGVNAKGEVASPLSIQLKEQAFHYAIRGAASAGGVFSMGIVPVAYACVGAMNPSFAYMHPVGKNVPHRRLKGAAIGFVNGLPGGFLISDSIIKGQEASIKPGDEFLAEFKQDFTGEPATDAEMMPNANKQVHAEVVKHPKKKHRK